ncbi:oxysterol-binding protein-related protein 2A-like isoform X1 [Triticum dicoccoides]|uniref:oxysterol-binding protein-related protein 2A-like isoform X1 n=1 Tax=Triticum dicoccoides TaxID=85692 RepID=UPI001890DA7A|nr:oxysterol-binding protein-related protein 2A-like isoform X1 [Triticum dicoccoides]
MTHSSSHHHHHHHHALCCLSSAPPQPEASPTPAPEPAAATATPGPGSVAVAGVLHKWTNYGRGWRERWFSLRDGVLSYSKIRADAGGGEAAGRIADDGEVRLIGGASAMIAGGRRPEKPVGVVCLKVSAFRESKSDDRRFYIFSPTKTLHLKTDSKDDRVAWIEALILARSVYSLRSLSGRITFVQSDISVSTARLRNRMHQDGLNESLIQDCEQIMLSEFSSYRKQLKLRYDDHLSLFGSSRHHFEEGKDGNIIQGALTKNEFSSSRHGNFSEYSTTESDEFEKQDGGELTCEEGSTFFDAADYFTESNSRSSTMSASTDCGVHSATNIDNPGGQEVVDIQIQDSNNMLPEIKRRSKLPEPTEKEKGISLWSIIKDSVGKDLTRVCLPVYFNEPLSSLQKCFEDFEYSYLLDQAYEYGKVGNSLMRILKVAAFAISGYASSVARPCKPFNPLLGETYEADFPDRRIRFFAEKVSHHPMLIACHSEGKGWKFWGDSNVKSKFWGQSIQVDPVGVLTVEFDDGEIFKWSKVTTTINNLILGKLYCNHHGIMHIKGNRQYSCKLKFKEPSLLDRNPHLVQGFVEDNDGKKASFLIGKWDESMYYSNLDTSKVKSADQLQGASLLWEKNKPSPNPTRYNLSSFAITLNELTPELQEKLPPTDSRLRPDQRHLENGEYEKANAEKLRLERRQRMSTKLQDNGWKPRWFEQDAEDGTYHYKGGYWEARDQGRWDGCLNIFGEFSET